MSKKRPPQSNPKEAPPEIVITDSANPVRDLTSFELGYARTHFRRLSWGHNIEVVLGMVMVPMGFVAAGLIGGEWNPRAPYLMLFAPILVMASLGLAAFILKFAPKRKYVLRDGAFVCDGIMEESVSRLFNPKTGQSATIRRYRIGDANIIWPPGGELIYRSFVNKRIQVTVALITRSNPLTLFGEQPKDAVVLEFGNSIRIHHALQKYGRNLFLIYHLNTVLVGVALSGLFVIAVIYIFPDSSGQSTFTALSTLIVQSVGFLFLLVVLFVVLERITAAVGIKLIPIEEKLRG